MGPDHLFSPGPAPHLYFWVKMATICVARLREGIKYTGPLDCIMDVHLDLYKEFMGKHPEFQYTFYNISFDGKRPKRNVESVEKADFLLISSDHEFHYFVPGYIHTLNLARSNEEIAKISPHIQGKTVILLRSDRADTPELFQTRTFAGYPFTMKVIDDMDFPGGGIGGMKYHFIKEQEKSGEEFFAFPIKKTLDFAYWGCTKSKGVDKQDYGDRRNKILKQVSKSDLKSCWIGRLQGIEVESKMRPLKEILYRIKQARTSLCFNWLDQTATTFRYQEAIACGMVPFLWQNYDTKNLLGADLWQRAQTIEEFVDKVQTLRVPDEFIRRFAVARENFLDILPSREIYYSKFEELLLKAIGGG